MTGDRTTTACGLAALALLVLVSGCGSAPEADTQEAAAKKAHQQSPDAYLVAAVKATEGTAPVAVRFELQDRPAPGTPFTLRVRVEAPQALEALKVHFEAPAGFEWLSAAPVITETKVQAGALLDRTLSLRTAAEGVFEIRALVSAEAVVGQATAADFAIPVIVSRPGAR